MQIPERSWAFFEARDLAKTSGWRRACSRDLVQDEKFELRSWLHSLGEPADAALEDGDWFGFWINFNRGNDTHRFDGTFRHPEHHAEFLLRWG